MQPLPPEAQMMNFILAKWISKPIHAAATLGIADLLADGPMAVADLARNLDVDAEALYRLLRSLAGIGIFCETETKCFSNTPLSQCLQEGRMRSAALMFHSAWHDAVWDNLLYTVRTGKPAFDKVHGEPVFEWLARHPREAKIFQQASGFKASHTHRLVLDVYNFANIETLTDIGGGSGDLMVEVLRAHPHMKGSVAERPYVIPLLEATIAKNNLQDRLKAIACDFFQHIPSGSDAYLLSHVLHDWPDDTCIRLLTNCRKAMPLNGRIIIIEGIVPPGNEFSIAKQLDLEVFLMGGGKERTLKEFEDLLRCSGLRLANKIDTRDYISVMEGVVSS
jgi:hypothetical protein